MLNKCNGNVYACVRVCVRVNFAVPLPYGRMARVHNNDHRSFILNNRRDTDLWFENILHKKLKLIGKTFGVSD